MNFFTLTNHNKGFYILINCLYICVSSHELICINVIILYHTLLVTHYLILPLFHFSNPVDFSVLVL